MPVQSMTGFSRSESFETAELVVELRSVNGKGLDLRLRIPPAFDALEPELRRMAAARLSRGNVQVSLQARETGGGQAFAINEAMLRLCVEASVRLVAAGHAAPPTADGLLALRGVIEPAEAGGPPRSGAADEAARAEALLAFGRALDGLVASRLAEGAAIAAVLGRRLDEIEALVARAEADPSRTPEAIRRRIAAQLADLLAADAGLDEARLHGEAALMATRADIREEIDRLRAHVEAARRLLAEGGPVGRKLDFLSQEFNRETNTICSKSNAAALTAIGLDLKTVVDQFREQVQNIE